MLGFDLLLTESVAEPRGFAKRQNLRQMRLKIYDLLYTNFIYFDFSLIKSISYCVALLFSGVWNRPKTELKPRSSNQFSAYTVEISNGRDKAG